MKKTIAILTAAVMLMTFFSVSVFAIGSGEVSTKAALVAAAADTSISTVKLTGDIDMGNDPLIFSRSATLDLNGHTLSGTGNNGQYSVVYVGMTGNLTINNSADGGKVVSSGETAVGVYGQLTINAGTFEGAYAALYNYYYDGLTYGQVTINGGTFIGHGDGAILNCGSMTINATPTLNGTAGSGLDNSGLLTITGAPTISAGNNYALILRDGGDASGVLGSGTVTLSTIAQLTIPAGLELYLDGTLTVNGSLTVNGTMSINGTLLAGDGGTIQNNGTINLQLGAADAWTSILTGDGDFNVVSGTEVTSGVDETYTIIIPSKVDFGTLARGTGIQEKPFTVRAEGVVLAEGASINVNVTNKEFEMKNGTAAIQYTLWTAEPEAIMTASNYVFATFAAGTADQSSTGKVTVNTANILYAGDYSGIMNFAIEYTA